MKIKKEIFREKKFDYYLFYTLIFGGIALILYLQFYLNGKSLIWSHDGVPQHLNSLAYYGEYLRGILHSLFVEHKLEIPMWDMNIGYGSDILATLHYYVIGDPLTLLSVFVPAEKTEYLYAFLVFFRIYLAGVAFSRFCFYHKNSKQATLLGSLVYIFAGWTIYASMKHPYFSNPMIYLPLILLGIDKIYRKEKPYVFIWSVTLAGISNFYFFYMLGIFMVLYAAFDYFVVFTKKEDRKPGAIIKWAGLFAGYSLIAVFMAAVILLPVVLPVFGTGRFQAENYVPLFYDRIYYEKYLSCLIGENMIQWGVAGYTAVAMTGVFVLFSKRKFNTALKWGFVLLNIFLLLPFAGHALNGFSYVSNRWIWAYGMMMAYIFVRVYPEIFRLNIKEKRRVLFMLLIYCGAALFPEVSRTERNMTAMILLVISTLAVLLYGSILQKKKSLCIMISGLLASGILFNIYYQYSYEKDYLSEFTDRGKALEKLESGTDLAVLDTDDPSVFRYDQLDALSYGNSSMHMGTNSTSYYFSLASSGIGEFFDEMYLNTPWEQQYENLDGRTILDRLASVKYFVVKNGEYRYLPYGYYWLNGSAEKEGRIYEAFESREALPLGYTYDSYIPRNVYEKLSVTEKQQALLQGVVLEDSNLPEAEPVFNDREIPYTVRKGRGCSVKDGKIRVTKEGAELVLNFDGLKNSETYLIVEGLDYDGLSPRETVSEKKWKKLSRYEKNKIIHQDSHWRYWKESQKASVTVSGRFPEKTIRIFTDKYNAYSGKHNFLCNTGYQKDERQSITLTFEKTGVYSFDDLRIVCQPMSRIDSQIENLKEEVLTDISMENNRIRGKVSLEKPKVLVLSIPYSDGFRAYVDGKEAGIKKANTMYMALELPKGEHEICLVYKTPFLISGLCLTLAGGICYICLVFVRKRKQKKKAEKK